MQTAAGTYNDKVVRQFAIATVLWGVVGMALAMLLAALYIPWVVGLLRFAPLPAHELAAACGLGVLSVVWFEAIKGLQRRQGRPARAVQADHS